METVAGLFPFPGGGEPVSDPIIISDACKALAEAANAETQACEALEAALGVDWPEP